MSEQTPHEPAPAPSGSRSSDRTEAPASRLTFLRQTWRVLLAAALGLPLAALVALWAVLHSERGTAWLLTGVPYLEVTAPKGAMLGPSFSAERVRYRWDQGRQHLEIEGLEWSGAQWRWWLRSGTWVGVEAQSLKAQRVVVNTGPATGQPVPLPASLELPFELRIQQLRVAQLEVDRLPAWREVSGRLELGGQQGRQHRVEELSFLWDELKAQGQTYINTLPPFEAVAQLAVAGTGAVAWEAELSARGPLQVLELQARFQAPALSSGLRPSLQGKAQLKPFAPWPLGTVDLTLQALDLAQLSSRLPATRLTGRAAVQSLALDQPVQADIVLDNAAAGSWTDARLPVRRLHLDLRSRIDVPDLVEIRHLDLDLGSTQRAAGQWRSDGFWKGAELRIKGTATDIQPQALDARAPAMTLSGPLQVGLLGVAVPRGEQPPGAARPSVPWTVELQGALSGALEGLGQRTTLTLEGSIKPDEVVVRQLLAEAGPARAQLTGSVTPSAGGAWQVRSTGQIGEFDPTPWVPGSPTAAWRKGPHRLNGQWSVDVTLPVWRAGASALQWLQTLQGSAQVELDSSRVAGVAASGRLKLAQNPAAPAAERSQLQGELRLGRNQFTVSGQGDPAGNGASDRWQTQASASALAELAPLAALWPEASGWIPQGGRLEASVTLRGRWPDLGSEGEMTIEGLKGSEYALTRGEARWQWSGQDSEPLALTGQVLDASLGPNRVARLRGDVRGTLRQHSASLDLALPVRPPEVLERVLELPAGTGTQARLSVEGGWAGEAGGGGRWAGTVRRLEAGVWSSTGGANSTAPSTADKPPERAWLDASDVRSELRFDAERRLRSLKLEAGQASLAAGLRLKWDEARYELRDPSRADRPDFQWQAEVLPFALAPWLQRAETGLQWTGDLRMSARMRVRAAERFDAEVSLRRHDGDLQVVESGQVQPLGISNVDLTLQARDGLWSLAPRFVGRSVGEVSGAVQLRTDPAARWPDEQAALSGSVQARVPNLGVWSGWIPAGWRVQGEMASTATLGGRFGAPQLTGDLNARSVGVRNLLQGVDYTDGELKVVLQGETARIERLSLRSGDGRVTGEGVGEFGARPSARVQVRAETFRVLGRLDRQLVASGQAVLALRPDQLKLDGRVLIDSGLFDLASRDAPTLDDDVKVRGPATAPTANVKTEAPALPRLVRQSSVTLDVDLGKKLRLRGRGLDTALQGDLKLTTPGGRLAVHGTVRAQGGTYAAYGQKLEIERGIVAFTGQVDTPRLDIVALRPNTDIRVGVAVSGTPQAPRARLFSEPEMGETDKLSWLLLGRGSEGLARNDTAVLQRAAVALLAGEGEAPTDSFLRAFGIDDLSLRQGEGDARETVISLGKQLSRNWYAGYERSVNATAGTFQLIYRVAQRFTLRAQSGLENSLDLIWTWRFDHLPGQRPPAQATPPPKKP